MTVLAALLFGGCKRYLDVTPQGKIIPETEEDFEALLNNMLYAIEEGTDEDILGCYDRVILYESISDNLDANISAGRLTLYAGDVANNFQKGYYEGLYSAIKDCNLILEHMLEKDSAKARALCAAAYAIKGVCYYNLIRIYCEPYDAATASSLPGIPIVERFDVESDAVPDRNTLARSYEYAVSLFRKAIDCHMTDESYLFTEAVAKTYLAKLYFWAEEWSEVIPLCEELLAVPSYALADRSVYTVLRRAVAGGHHPRPDDGRRRREDTLRRDFSAISEHAAGECHAVETFRCGTAEGCALEHHVRCEAG